MKKILSFSIFLVVFLFSAIVSAQVIPLDQKSWYSQSEEGAPPPQWNGDEQVRNMGTQNPATNMCIPQANANCNLFTVPGAAAIWEVRIRDGNGATLADVMLMDGSAIAITELALETVSANYFWHLTDTFFAAWGGDSLANETYAVTNDAPFVQNFNYSYDSTNQEWRQHNILATNADGQSLDENAMVVASYLYGYNGATMDLLRLGAVGELQVTDVATRPGEDAGNDWRKVKKEAIAVYTPAKTADTAVDDAAGGDVGDEVYAPTEVLGYPNWCVVFKNEGGGAGDVLVDAAVLVSPSNAAGEWENLTFAACDALASAGGTCSYCCSNCSHRYVKAEALCGAGDDTTVTVWITANVN